MNMIGNKWYTGHKYNGLQSQLYAFRGLPSYLCPTVLFNFSKVSSIVVVNSIFRLLNFFETQGLRSYLCPMMLVKYLEKQRDYHFV